MRRLRWAGSALAVLPVLAAALSGCSAGVPTVTVSVGEQREVLQATQYCLDGETQLYRDRPPPPVLRVRGDQPIRIDVPEEVAEAGWAVQVFDDDLERQIGRVDAGHASSLDRIRTGDAAQPEYYLVIVQDGGSGCDGLAGAWPIGVVRT